MQSKISFEPTHVRATEISSSSIFLVCTSAIADNYPKNPDIDIIHYSFQITLSDEKDVIDVEATIDFVFRKKGMSKLSLDFVGISDELEGRGMCVLDVTEKGEPVCSCGEENLLAFEGDPYSSENILIHEFAHNIHYRGMDRLDPTFDNRLKASYEKAIQAGLWEGKYASVNHSEYFAEGVQSWFDNNRQPDHDHNFVDTREELKEYDPGLASICEEIFGDTQLVYTKPTTRLIDHMAGYNPSKAPRFVWSERLLKVKIANRENGEREGKNRKKKYVH